MTDFANDLNVPYNSKIEKLRENFNALLGEFDKFTPVGELSALQTPAPTNTSLVGAINYVYNLLSGEGSPVNFVVLNECYVPFSSSLYFSNNTSTNTRFTQLTNQTTTTERDLVLYSKDNITSLYVLYSGQIGIGKIPTTSLDVNGTTKTNSLQITNNTYSTTLNYANNSLTVSSNSTITLGNQSNKNLFINAVSSPGNVGIGYTELEPIPELLSLKSSATNVGINLKTTTTNWSIKTDSTNSLLAANEGTSILTITKSGKVGIMNTDPQNVLSVNGSFSASDVYFTGKLYSGAVEIASASGINVSLKNIYDITASASITASSFKVGSTTIIESDAKIDWNKIKNISLSTTSISEGSNLYYTSNRVRSLLNSSYFNIKQYTKSALLAINPSTAGKSAIAYISDTGYEGLAVSDGTNWKYISLGATIT